MQQLAELAHGHMVLAVSAERDGDLPDSWVSTQSVLEAALVGRLCGADNAPLKAYLSRTQWQPGGSLKRLAKGVPWDKACLGVAVDLMVAATLMDSADFQQAGSEHAASLRQLQKDYERSWLEATKSDGYARVHRIAGIYHLAKTAEIMLAGQGRLASHVRWAEDAFGIARRLCVDVVLLPPLVGAAAGMEYAEFMGWAGAADDTACDAGD